MPTYIRLTDYKSSDEKERGFFKPENRYEAKQEDFEKIPGSPIAYWVSDRVKEIFESEKLNDISLIRQGTATGDTERFIRKWFEVSFKLMKFDSISCEEAINSSFKWFPITKGGEFRRYFGNNEDVISFDKVNYNILLTMGNNLPSREYYFSKGITWTKISSSSFGVRALDKGFIFSDAGMIIIPDNQHINYLCGFLLSKVSYELIKVKNTSLNFQAGDLKSLPIVFPKQGSIKQNIDILTQQNIDISRKEWDSRETSWDFRTNELIRVKNEELRVKSCRIEDVYDAYCDYWREKFFQLHANEEELNRLFIDIYELQDELTPDVPLEDITILKNEAKIVEGELVFQADEIMKQLISYGVGVMFGRYALEKEGLQVANLGQELPTKSAFEVDDDNIIPVLEDDYFKDDIASRFVQFIKTAFGEEHLSENIQFIEEALGTPLRKYFVKGFYDDHIRRYKKRPIYWMVASPKKSFMALMYMHRYQPDIFARVRNSYLTEYMAKLEAHKETLHLTTLSETASNKDKKDAAKQIEKIEKKLKELIAFDREKMMGASQNSIAIDLDDGVKVNYCKFKEILYPITGLCKK